MNIPLKDFAPCHTQSRHRLHPRTRPPPPPWPCRGRWHLCHGCQHPGRSPWGHPSGPAKRHHHSRHFHHPPPSHQHPSCGCDNGRRAAARRDQQKRATDSRVETNGHLFVPFSVESYGRIGQPALKLLHALGDEAAGPGGVTRASLVAGAFWEISAGLCRGNFFMYRACLGLIAKASGTGFRAGMLCPWMNMGCCRVPAWGGLLAMPLS
jgi:hypothetical protein